MTEQFILPIALTIIGILVLIHQKRKKMVVKITKCSVKSYWYSNSKFDKFKVVDYDKKNYMAVECFCTGKMRCAFCSEGGTKYIEKRDCLIVRL